MRKVCITILILVFVALCALPLLRPATATPIHSTATDKLGGYTGNSGSGAADNVKADLDIVDALVDLVLVNQNGTGDLIAGREYALTMNMGSANDDDLFEVLGGPILITSLTFYCTTDVGATNTWTIILDHADKDVEFTSAVDVAGANDGDRIVFTSANPAILTILALTANIGSTNLMSPWFCPVGMIEVVNDDSTTTGVFDVYITFIPLTTGVTVTAK